MLNQEKVDKIKEIIARTVTGKIEPRHLDTGHRYFFVDSGFYQASVTTKLGVLSKPHLLNWAVKVGLEWILADNSRLNKLATERFRDDMIRGAQLAHTDLRDSAGLTGGRTHSIAERYLNDWIASGERPKDIMTFIDTTRDDPRAIAGARGFELLCKQKNIIPIASEIIVGMPKISAGAIDIICLYENELCLLDIKTSNAVDKNFRYQLAGYKYMFESMTKLPIKKVKIIHLDKGMDRYTIYEVKELPKAWQTFKHICKVYDDVMSKKDKVVKDVKRISI